MELATLESVPCGRTGRKLSQLRQSWQLRRHMPLRPIIWIGASSQNPCAAQVLRETQPRQEFVYWMPSIPDTQKLVNQHSMLIGCNAQTQQHSSVSSSIPTGNFNMRAQSHTCRQDLCPHKQMQVPWRCLDQRACCAATLWQSTALRPARKHHHSSMQSLMTSRDWLFKPNLFDCGCMPTNMIQQQGFLTFTDVQLFQTVPSTCTPIILC